MTLRATNPVNFGTYLQKTVYHLKRFTSSCSCGGSSISSGSGSNDVKCGKFCSYDFALLLIVNCITNFTHTFQPLKNNIKYEAQTALFKDPVRTAQ